MVNSLMRNLISVTSGVVVYYLGIRFFQRPNRKTIIIGQENLNDKDEFYYRGVLKKLYDKYKIMVYLDWLKINDVKDDFKMLKRSITTYIDKGFEEFSLNTYAIYEAFHSCSKNDTTDNDLITKFLSLDCPSENNCSNTEYQNVYAINEVHSYITILLTLYIK
jgi:hypothetical protein